MLPSNAYTFDNDMRYPSTELKHFSIINNNNNNINIEACPYIYSYCSMVIIKWAVVMSTVDMKYATRLSEYGHTEAATLQLEHSWW